MVGKCDDGIGDIEQINSQIMHKHDKLAVLYRKRWSQIGSCSRQKGRVVAGMTEQKCEEQRNNIKNRPKRSSKNIQSSTNLH